MGDRVLVALFLSVFVIWGIVCVKNPTFAFRYEFGRSRNRKKTPEKHELLYHRTIGYFFIVFGVSLIIAALMGALTE